MKIKLNKQYLFLCVLGGGAAVTLAAKSEVISEWADRLNSYYSKYEILQHTMNYPLYKNEFSQYRPEGANENKASDRDTENAEYKKIGQELLAAQERMRQYAIEDGEKNPIIRRVFHAKQHACLAAEIKLVPQAERKGDEAGLTGAGLFDTHGPQTYKALIRLSSGVGVIIADAVPDVKGFAIKVFDVENRKLNGNGAIETSKKTMDLLMTSGPNPFGHNLRDFADFMNAATTRGNSAIDRWNPIWSPLAAKKFIDAKENATKVPTVSSLNKFKSLAAMTFWSGHPYLLSQISDSTKDIAMKFNVVPRFTNVALADGSISILKVGVKNFLRQDLEKRLSQGDLHFDLNLQLEKDGTTTPVEDTLVEWTEANSPSIKVAEITIPKQRFNQTEIDSICEELSFTPGNYIEQNRPLSNMGRGRIIAYAASQLGRGAKSEPTVEVYEKIKALSQTPAQENPSESTDHSISK